MSKSNWLLKVCMPPVSCKHGAPMGRACWDSEPLEKHKFYLRPVRFVDGCYDSGGAYWGCGTPLWIAYAEGKEEIQRFFVRAWSREGAWAQVHPNFPNSSLIKR